MSEFVEEKKLNIWKMKIFDQIENKSLLYNNFQNTKRN